MLAQQFSRCDTTVLLDAVVHAPGTLQKALVQYVWAVCHTGAFWVVVEPLCRRRVL